MGAQISARLGSAPYVTGINANAFIKAAKTGSTGDRVQALLGAQKRRERRLDLGP